jgi:histone H3/H4
MSGRGKKVPVLKVTKRSSRKDPTTLTHNIKDNQLHRMANKYGRLRVSKDVHPILKKFVEDDIQDYVTRGLIMMQHEKVVTLNRKIALFLVEGKERAPQPLELSLTPFSREIKQRLVREVKKLNDWKPRYKSQNVDIGNIQDMAENIRVSPEAVNIIQSAIEYDLIQFIKEKAAIVKNYKKKTMKAKYLQ